MFPFDLGNSTVLIPRHGKRHEPFSTQNSQATLGRHSNLTGPFIRSLTGIFRHQYSLTTCRFKFVLHATHMSRDDLFFKNLPPLQKSSIRATISLTISTHLATHQSSTVTSSTHTVFKPARSPPLFGNFSCLLLLSSASFDRCLSSSPSSFQITTAAASAHSQRGLAAAHWKLSSREVSYQDIGDSIADSCTIIIAIHSSCASNVEPITLKTPPSVTPRPIGAFIWEPFNRIEHLAMAAIPRNLTAEK